jgi:hypothetical protein
MSRENGNGIVSPSPHPEHDEEREYQLCRMEMRRIRAAQAKQQQQQQQQQQAEAEKRRQLRIEACDVTSDQFKIVCEELWVDFKTWVTYHENMKNSLTKTRTAFKRNLAMILFVFAFLICFRWYIGGGREACARFSVSGIILNFVCKLFRYLGEALLGILLGIMGFCVGILPLVVCVCVFEFTDAFPDPVPVHVVHHHIKKD